MSVTPARRQRSLDDDGDSEEDISVDGDEVTPPSTRSKRVRLSASEDEAEDETDEEQASMESGTEYEQREQLLPDNYLRSPKHKQRAKNPVFPTAHEAEHDTATRPHQPGSIIRVKVTDFVTYTENEFHFGPNLNMIIGPNGTGKSTLVCAICLGLGWKTQHLGRAKDIGEFVKHGKRKATIEIELAADPARQQHNPVITTKIIKDGNKTEFMINGEKSSNKSVRNLAESFSIQIDNLCQFLPQDRVCEFAGISPVELLNQTQRAAASEEMTQWHDQLKTMRKSQKKQQDLQQIRTEELKNKENRQRGQETDVQRLRERSTLQTRLTGLEKMRPFPAYQVVVKEHKALRKEQSQAVKSLQRLAQQLGPNLKAVTDRERAVSGIQEIVKRHEKLLSKTEGLATNHAKTMQTAVQTIDDCKTKTNAEKEGVKTARTDIARLQQLIANIDRTLATPVESVDHAEMNEQIRLKREARQEVAAQVRTHREQMESFELQIRQREAIIQRIEDEQASLQTQLGQQEAKLRNTSPDTHTAWKWIQANRNSFRSAVFGPPIVECSVKDTSKAAPVESVLGQADLTAFTVTDEEDFRMLNRQLRDKMRLRDINIRSIRQPLSYFRSPLSKEQLSRYHMDGLLIDLLDGAEEVLAMLCDNKAIHQTPYTSRDINDEQYRDLEKSPITSWVTSTSTYHIIRRREYGDGAVSVRTNGLRKPQFFNQGSGGAQVDDGSSREAGEARREIEEDIKPQWGELKTAHKQLQQQERQLEGEEKEIKEQKTRAQLAVANRQSLSIKRDDCERKRTAAEERISQTRANLLELVAEKDHATVKKGQAALDHASTIEQLRLQHITALGHAIWLIEARSDLEQLEARTADDRAQIEQRRAEVALVSHAVDAAKARGEDLAVECRAVGQSPEYAEVLAPIYEEVHRWMPEQLETEIQSVQARVEMISGGENMNILLEFEERARTIEKLRHALAGIEARLNELDADIREIRERWEPRLDAIVEQISEAFAQNFASINCAGEVSIHKDEDFELWAIHIKVKFRENEQLCLLDAHRQSGGERAVSTSFYLFALQSLARAPFRVVDEINQGMDPRNERLVHARMVDIACSEASASQYFLITPKLLPNLRYHASMKVHCIASGEYMPDDHRGLNFERLAQQALAVRKRQQGVAS